MTFEQWYANTLTVPSYGKDNMRKAWDAATQAERRRCAKIAHDAMVNDEAAGQDWDAACVGIAGAIRKGDA